MDKLWSPWRSQYIESFSIPKEKDNCVFCRTIQDNLSDDKCLKVHDGKLCFVMMNLYPYNSGHLMVIPHRHLSNLDELSKDELSEMMDTVKLSMKALELVMKPQGFNFGANLGKAAGAGIDDHIHFHIVPRWKGDTNFMPVLGEVKVISQDLLQTKKLLVEAFNNITKEKV